MMPLSVKVMVGSTAATVLAGAVWATSFLQDPQVRVVEERLLREYTGVYQWQVAGVTPGSVSQGQTPSADAFVYLQMWNELAGTNQLVAFDESGDIRTLYPTEPDRFVTGPTVAASVPVEARIEFQRDTGGAIRSLTWQREGEPARTASQAAIERRDDVRFASGDVRLSGTLISPVGPGPHPAIILVHYSGAATRDSLLPFARFLIRHGVAVLGYDKRGVGASSGDWHTASFEDLAGDAVAAFEYLKTRRDIDGTKVGLLGVSQAGWIMPIAAVRAPDLAFLISVSGAGVPMTETTIDSTRNVMTARGAPPQAVEQVVALMQRQYDFARTGRGWDEYAALRATIAARMGAPPDNFPATPDDPYWRFIRPLALYDPAPTLAALRVPTLAIFGEFDDNILAEKNKAAWERALQAGGHPNYALHILPRANHMQFEAPRMSAEIASIRRFVPAYAATVHQWLATQLRGSRTGSN